MQRAQLNEIIRSLEPHVQALGFSIRDIHWLQGEKSLCIFIESPTKVVDVADCAQVSRALNQLEQLDQFVAGSYCLQVSSPGIEAPLRTLEHFSSAVGKEIEWLESGKKKTSGVLESIDTEQPVQITLRGKNGYKKTVPVESLLQAKLKFNWENLGEAR